MSDNTEKTAGQEEDNHNTKKTAGQEADNHTEKMLQGDDYIVRATAGQAQIRAFAITSRTIVETARQKHHTSPVVTAALGRLLSAGAMMGSMLKNDTDILTLQISGSGPVRGLTVTADARANVKGYALVPDVMLPPNAQGKLDVGGAVGDGMLQVIKDLGMKEPYCGQTVLQTGEIAEDLTYYFATSEQIPSSVGLGVLMNKDNTVRCAGGFVIQLMPFAEESTIEKLEQNLAGITSVTKLLDEGKTPEEILSQILDGLSMEIVDRIPARFYCNCDKSRIEKAIISIGEKDIREMIEDGKEIEVNCHFCNTNYTFSVDELKTILKKAQRRK